MSRQAPPEAQADAGREGPRLPAVRLDYWPLHNLALAKLTRASLSGQLVDENCGVTDGQLAAVYGSSRRQVIRWRQSGRISLAAADRCAVAVGRLPFEVWGADYFSDLTPEPGAEADFRTGYEQLALDWGVAA